MIKQKKNDQKVNENKKDERVSEIKFFLDSLFIDDTKDIKKNITFYISQNSIDKLFELTKKHNISKSTFIENLINLVYDIDLS